MMIEVSNVTKRYGGVLAVNDLSFRVEEGRTLALIGTSGCGKTTTLKMINRLVEPSAGQIRIGGADIRRRSPEELRRHIGYVIQQTGLFPHYTVEENVATVPRLLGWPAGRIRERSRQLLGQLGLPPDRFARRYPAQLSGGQQQRVGLARALAADPPIVLMDEPFGALDPITRRDIRRDFRELPALASKTVIIVTHDVEEAFELADQICLLDRGELQQQGPPQELLFRPENAFVARFLAGRQLLLELEAVRLADLIPYLPAAGPAGGAPAFPAALPVRAALEKLTRRDQPAGSGKMMIGAEGGPVDLAGLLSAFFKYLKNQ